MESCLYLASPALDPQTWKLVATDRGGASKYLEARVEAVAGQQSVTEFLLKKMALKVVTAKGEVLEEATLSSQVDVSVVEPLLDSNCSDESRSCQEMPKST